MRYSKIKSLDLTTNRAMNPGKCVGYEQITLDYNNAVGLDLSVCSQTPRWAIMSIECDTETLTIAVARYLINGEIPDNDKYGMPKYATDVWTIISTEDLVRFRIIGTGEEKTVSLHVEYYA